MGSSFIKSGSKLLTSSLDFCQTEKAKERDVKHMYHLLDPCSASSLVLSAMSRQPPQPRLGLPKAFSGVGPGAAGCPHRASISAKPFAASEASDRKPPSDLTHTTSDELPVWTGQGT